jgi:glycosyltransferase involved in cell wall biosynthesis
VAEPALRPTTPRLVTADGRPPRVAHLTTVDLSLAMLLATELTVDVESGAETWGISAPGPYVDEVEALGVRHAAVPSFDRSWNLRNDRRAAAELARVIRRVRPDVLHTHTPKAGVLGRVLGRTLGVPVVVDTCHGLWTRPDQRPWVRRAVVAAEAVASRFAHAELYQNAEDRATMRRFVGSRGRVVGNGVDLTRFVDVSAAARERVRRELGADPGELLVGGVGRMVREKGIEEFVSVAGALSAKARFVWVGPPDDSKADAVGLAAEHGEVRFAGVRHDMPEVYAALDVFVLPSWREGFSRSGMEAAATGLPMVLSDIRGCRELGQHDRELLLVPPRDPDALTAAVSRLVDDDDLRDRLGAAARAKAFAEFDQRAVAARSLATYVDVANRRGLRWRLDPT